MARKNLDDLKTRLSKALELLAHLETEDFDGARGTNDVTEAARRAVEKLEKDANEAARLVQEAKKKVAAPPTLAARIEALLRARPHFVDEVVASLKEPAEKVAAEIERLKTARRIHNVGNDRNPRYTWIIGDETSMADLVLHIKPLLIDGPMMLADIVEATGARRNRVSGALLELKKKGEPLMNLGNGHFGRWFIAAPLKSVRAKPMPDAGPPPDRKRR